MPAEKIRIDYQSSLKLVGFTWPMWHVHTQALEASGTAGVRVKAIANASGSLSFLQKSSSDHSTVKLYIVKGWTSNAAIHLQQQALPQLSANAINLLRKEGPLVGNSRKSVP